MSIVLPKELQTRKVKSLPAKDRKLVDELLAEKFNIKEEVVPRRDDSFRQEYPGQFNQHAGRLYNAFDESADVHSRQAGVMFGINYDTRSRVARVPVHRNVSARYGIDEAHHKLDMENAPHNSRKLFLHRERVNYLLQEVGALVGLNVHTKTPEYNGCEIITIPSQQEEYIQVMY